MLRPATTRTGLTIGLLALALGGALVQPGTALADRMDERTGTDLTLAVFGDSPYGTKPSDTAEFNSSPAFIDTINADPDVSTVLHAGDIHSGKQYCTADYDRSVAQLWTRFADPLVYTPGDNEWADCHKAKEGGGTHNATTGQIDYLRNADGSLVDYAGGNPVANLDLIRSIFFPKVGKTLGGGHLKVESQGKHKDKQNPTDQAYVENVRWVAGGVQFVVVNVPGGSNNDADPWYGAPAESAEQRAEREARTGAALRWIDSSFAAAQQDRDLKAVVVMTQADMWDLDGGPADHLSNYEPMVKSLADHTNALDKPVLLLNGDSHHYRSDNPFSASAPCETESGSATVACVDSVAGTHPGYAVPKFHRITVHGSKAPLEWLKLTVQSRGTGMFGPFSWTRVVTDLGS